LPSTRFLFWNINRKPLAEVIAELAEENGIDVVILAESEIDPNTLLRTLNRGTVASFHLSVGFSPAIRIFTRFSQDFLMPIYESDRVSIRRLALPARLEVLLVAAHLPSKLHWSAESQSFGCTELALQIAAQEDRAGHRRTVVVGDFNMNPFEFGIVAAGGLHAVMSRRIAARAARVVQGRDYQMFYNPMWNHLGDAMTDTAGSYYYDNAEHVNYFWNMFDQVLIRPELAERFDPRKLHILKSVGTNSLVRRDGRPNDGRYSDHLPLVFEMDF
jgi:endonuclease/exonuclease/phosphatase family metal-dependent hydrolase